MIPKPYTVVVIVEASAGREAELKQALQEVVEPSRAEKTCLSYHLHQDLENPARFVLYESWVSKEAHVLQFEKPYILALIPKLEGLLDRPFQAIFAEEVTT